MSFFNNLNNMLMGGNNMSRNNMNNNMNSNNMNNNNPNSNGINGINGINRTIKNLFKFNTRSSCRCIYKLITKEQSKELIENNRILLIDVRSKEEYDSIHIQNAINLPVDNIENTIFNIEPNKNANIMIYCTSGSRSKMAIQKINMLGYNNIYIWEYAALANFPYKELFVYGNKMN